MLRQVVAVDGTWLPAMADVAWAVTNKNNHGATRHRARLDARVHVASGLPELLVVPEAYLYVTIIAAMLMYRHTGYRPSKYLFSLLSQVAAGGVTLEEVLPILRERERRAELDRQSRARRAAKKRAKNK